MRARILLGVLLGVVAGRPAGATAQITRHPTGLNVNAQGATSAFITFGNLDGYVPVEAIWCGEIEAAAPDIGDRCVAGTVFGALPLRYDLAVPSGNDGLTDIMSIPPSVARRAYQSAETGVDSRFFYVRRFADATGQGRADQFVTVTCRMTGGGARTPLSLTDVRLSFADHEIVGSIPSGDALPEIEARLVYTGSGRLSGRWEIVLPGEEPPEARDLLSEAALPIEERALQRRYTQLSRFYVFLPPTGEFTLQGPDVSKIPTTATGQYQILLRIEATADKEGDSSLEAAGAGVGTVVSAGVAGFPIPPLRYWVGTPEEATAEAGDFALLQPVADAQLAMTGNLTFRWSSFADVGFYRLEITGSDTRPVISALLPSSASAYVAPDWLRDRAGREGIRWRVVALAEDGSALARTAWRVGTWQP